MKYLTANFALAALLLAGAQAFAQDSSDNPEPIQTLDSPSIEVTLEETNPISIESTNTSEIEALKKEIQDLRAGQDESTKENQREEAALRIQIIELEHELKNQKEQTAKAQEETKKEKEKKEEKEEKEEDKHTVKVSKAYIDRLMYARDYECYDCSVRQKRYFDSLYATEHPQSQLQESIDELRDVIDRMNFMSDYRRDDYLTDRDRILFRNYSLRRLDLDNLYDYDDLRYDYRLNKGRLSLRDKDFINRGLDLDYRRQRDRGFFNDRLEMERLQDRDSYYWRDRELMRMNQSRGLTNPEQQRFDGIRYMNF